LIALEGSILHPIFLFCLYLDAEMRGGDRSQGGVLQTQAVDLDIKSKMHYIAILDDILLAL
jgi:hypothetical protein